MRFLLKATFCLAVLPLLSFACQLYGQEYSVRAVDVKNDKPLEGIPITLLYDCTSSGVGLEPKVKCKHIQRKTGADGIAHFPEAGSLKNIVDFFSLPIKYGEVCCDISDPIIPGMGTIKFRRRSVLHWLYIGD